MDDLFTDEKYKVGLKPTENSFSQEILSSDLNKTGCIFCNNEFFVCWDHIG